MSIEGSPLTIHSATCLPNPPACVTHTASQIHTPRTLADSPTIEPASGVNENIPLIERSGSDGPHPPLERREEACGLGLGDVEVGGRERHRATASARRRGGARPRWGVTIGSWR